MAGFLALPRDIQRSIIESSGVPLGTIKAVSKGWLQAGRSIYRKLVLTGNKDIPADGLENTLIGLDEVSSLTILKGAFRGKAIRPLTIKNIVKAGSYEEVVLEACPEVATLLAELHHHLNIDRLEHLSVRVYVELKRSLPSPRLGVPNILQSLDLEGVPSEKAERPAHHRRGLSRADLDEVVG